MSYSTHLLRHIRLTIGQNIHRLRMRQHMTLEDLAKCSDISERLLKHYELGKNVISLEHLFAISCALESSVSDLMSGTDIRIS